MMRTVGSRRIGNVKWYIPSIVALAVGVVGVVVWFVLRPPAGDIDVPPFDPEDDRTELALRMEDDATSYVLSGMENVTVNSKIVDGKMVYDPVEVRGPVTSVFRTVEYQARFQGIWQLQDTGTGGAEPMITGTLKGTATVPWDPMKKPSADDNVTTRCKILDENPKGRFLVEGTIWAKNRPILIGPGATIENARIDKKPMTFLDTFGNRHTLLPGEKVTVDSAGQWIEDDDITPAPPDNAKP